MNYASPLGWSLSFGKPGEQSESFQLEEERSDGERADDATQAESHQGETKPAPSSAEWGAQSRQPGHVGQRRRLRGSGRAALAARRGAVKAGAGAGNCAKWQRPRPMPSRAITTTWRRLLRQSQGLRSRNEEPIPRGHRRSARCADSPDPVSSTPRASGPTTSWGAGVHARALVGCDSGPPVNGRMGLGRTLQSRISFVRTLGKDGNRCASSLVQGF